MWWLTQMGKCSTKPFIITARFMSLRLKDPYLQVYFHFLFLFFIPYFPHLIFCLSFSEWASTVPQFQKKGGGGGIKKEIQTNFFLNQVACAPQSLVLTITIPLVGKSQLTTSSFRVCFFSFSCLFCFFSVSIIPTVPRQNHTINFSVTTLYGELPIALILAQSFSPFLSHSTFFF
jgi:hypothetical protein